jgi:pimeloyl-ACP methyl ester carboxylesterase
MSEHPEIRYAKNAGVSIAYTRWGQGDHVVVYTPPWVSNLELDWDVEEQVRAYEHAGNHYRVLKIDKRGVGLSDRTNSPPTIEERVADTLAVMDAEGIERADVVGFSEGGSTGIALAAKHSSRVDKLVLVGSLLPGIPWEEFLTLIEENDPKPDGMQRIRMLVETWGTDESTLLPHFMPDVAGNPRIEGWARRFERQSSSPGSLRVHLESSLAGSIRDDIDRLKCPTFIGHCIGDLIVPVASSRYLASKISHATLRLWDDRNHMLFFSSNWREMHDDIIEFITETRPARQSTAAFGAVLFTDIVDSTAQARKMGDAAWAQLIRAHDTVADRVVTYFGGRRVKSTGDGILAMFEDPGHGVSCAIELRNEMKLLGLRIRAGLHAGQIEIQPDGDISGFAVNLAARVEPVGSPGDICVSHTVRDLLLGSVVNFESLGKHELKGIGREVEVLRVV